MSDDELSKILGRYQRMESLGILLGVLCIIVGAILAFIQHSLPLFAALFFVGVALLVFIGAVGQKKKKALIQQQLGGFFQEELEKAFGPEPSTPVLPIDKAFIKSSGLIFYPWEECRISSFHEGVHAGRCFSAANVELSHSWEEKSGPNNDNWMTHSETIFRGVFIRCRDICPPFLNLTVCDQMQKLSDCDQSAPEVFRLRFKASTSDGGEADCQITPELRQLIAKFEKSGAGRLFGLSISSGELALALQTNYIFADIPEQLDARDIDGMRKWYTASLTGMGNLLDILRESPALSGK